MFKTFAVAIALRERKYGHPQLTPHSAMGKTKGRYVTKPAGAPAKTPKALKTAAALYATGRRKLGKQLLQESEAWEQRQAEAAAASTATTAAHEALLTSISAARSLAEEEAHARTTFGSAARGSWDTALAQAAETREKLSFRQGERLDETQSRMILLVYSRCVETGFSPEAAVAETASTLRIAAFAL